MQLRKLKVERFRGIAALEWDALAPFCCLIGPGDAGKSSVLDAIDAALSSRWFSFADSDFFDGDTVQPIVIETTIGELSRALKSDERFGLYIRGWTATGTLRDEPEGDDEAVLTVRLTVDATLEPVWELVCDRLAEPRTLSNRDRGLFGVVRLAGEDARHLAWGQGSVLSRLTGDKDEAAARLAEAYKAARASANLHTVQTFSDVAKLAQSFAQGLGAYVDAGYIPGLELGRSGLSAGAIALHDGGVPLRLAGLGTRRLATLAIQKSAISEGAIILVDEIEHGLEPHRIIGAIAQLKSDQARSASDSKPIGQVIMTTHSDVALKEAGPSGLFVVQSTRPRGVTRMSAPQTHDAMRAVTRFSPGAMFARRILVCEGTTETGLLSGLREHWRIAHNGVSVEQVGSAIADGHGGNACAMATVIAELGYNVALFRDSDVPLTPQQSAALALLHVPIFEYGYGLNTEHAIFSSAHDAQVQELLDYARLERSDDAVNNALSQAFAPLPLSEIRKDFSAWNLVGIQRPTVIAKISGVAVEKGKSWFKDERVARGLAPIVAKIIQQEPQLPLALTIAAAETWLYG